MLSLTRIRESAALLGAILVVVALISALAVGMVGFLAQQATDGVRAGLATRAGRRPRAARRRCAPPPTPTKQDAEVRAAIADSFAPTGVDMQVWRSVEKRVTLRTTDDDGSDRDWTGMAASYDDARERLEIVDGDVRRRRQRRHRAGAGGRGPRAGGRRAAAHRRGAIHRDAAPGGPSTTSTRAGTATRWSSTGLEAGRIRAVRHRRRRHGAGSKTTPRVRWTIDARRHARSPRPTSPRSPTRGRRSTTAGAAQVDGLETLEKQGRFAQTAAELGVRVDRTRARSSRSCCCCSRRSRSSRSPNWGGCSRPPAPTRPR